MSLKNLLLLMRGVRLNTIQVLVFCALLTLASPLYSGRYINDTQLWKHVVTIDRLAWLERGDLKKINKSVDDTTFVRRLYLDITGKVPTYLQIKDFLSMKEINKREKLIEKLLSSPGYVSHFTNFWLDLLRGPLDGSAVDHFHREFTRHVERFLHENRSYDQIVYDFIMAKGTVQENPAIGFYYRDRQTSPMDTFNATTRAFLGTRLGCAQCHNHRFDKWTQKQFYESAAHFWGVSGRRTFYRPEEFVWSNHIEQLAKKNPLFRNLSVYSDVIFKPSRANVTYNENEKLEYPENYRYDNAKPLAAVHPKIVFEYGNTNVEGKDPRETFAKWMTSKENIRFAQIMPNRLWKRIMGATMMEPLDDWKDDIIINNPKLLQALGEIFVDVNYDFKALLTIIFNSEAYQLATDVRNQFTSEEYKFQGAMVKRMSAFQIKDSLLTFKYGNLDPYNKYDDQYFEFETKLYAIANEFRKNVVPITKALIASDSAANYRECRLISEDINELMITAMEKLKEIEAYYDIGKDGFLKSQTKKIVYSKEQSKDMRESNQSMMMRARTSRLSNPKSGLVMRASYHQNNSELMETFGLSEYSAPDTTLNTKATMKQILKLLNSQEVKDAIGEGSHIMNEVKKLDKFVEKIKYLYYSIYGRSPNNKDVAIAKEFIDETGDWSNYILALLNSPEFYFIK